MKLESASKSGGFDYVIPKTVESNPMTHAAYEYAMTEIQNIYNKLRNNGVPAEDARYVLPNGTTCNLVLTGNLRSILEFYRKRADKQAQWEIRELAEEFKKAVASVEPWTEPFFG